MSAGAERKKKMNFELIDNGFQITILGLSTIAAFFLALRYKSRSLLILALAYACFCMGTAYYILYLVIMGKVPQVFYVAEISWLAAWLFYLSVQILRIERIGYRFPGLRAAQRYLSQWSLLLIMPLGLPISFPHYLHSRRERTCIFRCLVCKVLIHIEARTV